MSVRGQLLAAAIINAVFDENDHEPYIGSLNGIISPLEFDWQIWASSGEIDEAVHILKDIGCLKLYQHQTIPDYVVLDSRKFYSKMSDILSDVPSLSGKLRKRYPVLASYVDLDIGWFEDAMAGWKRHNQRNSQIVPVSPDISDKLYIINQSLHEDIFFDPESSEVKAMMSDLDRAVAGIRGSNQLDPETKSTHLRHLDNGIGLFNKAGKISVGALKFLLIDRLKKAYEDAVEESLKILIQGALIVLILTLASRI